MLDLLVSLAVVTSANAPDALPSPIPCAQLVRRAGLVGHPVTNRTLSLLLLEANKERRVVAQDGALDARAAGLATIDYLSCFSDKKGAK